jgi:hypothetical protein
VHVAPLADARLGLAGNHLGARYRRGLEVFDMDHVEMGFLQQLRLGVAEHPAERRIGAQETPADREHRDPAADCSNRAPNSALSGAAISAMTDHHDKRRGTPARGGVPRLTFVYY